MARTNAFGMTTEQVEAAQRAARQAEVDRLIEERRRVTEAEHARRIAEREANQSRVIEAWRDAARLLDAVIDPVARAVLDLHARVGGYYSGGWVCEGCDSSGYECERPDWPCQTTRLVAEQMGITLPEFEAIRPTDGSADAR